MAFHHHSEVNALINPVTVNDVVVAESGEKYIVCQNMIGHYWLEHAMSGHKLTQPVAGQIEIVRQIADLVNI